MLSKCLLHVYVGNHRSVLLSTVVREALWCSGQQSVRTPSWSVLEVSDSWVLSPSWDTYITTIQTHGIQWKRRQKELKSQAEEKRSETLSSGQDVTVALMNPWTEGVIAYAKSSQSTFHHRWGRVHKALPLGEELWAVDGF